MEIVDIVDTNIAIDDTQDTAIATNVEDISSNADGIDTLGVNIYIFIYSIMKDTKILYCIFNIKHISI